MSHFAPTRQLLQEAPFYLPARADAASDRRSFLGSIPLPLLGLALGGFGPGGRNGTGDGATPLGDAHRRLLRAIADDRQTYDREQASYGQDSEDRIEAARDEVMAAREALVMLIVAGGGFDWSPTTEQEDIERATIPLAQTREGNKLYLLVADFDPAVSVEIEHDGCPFVFRPVVVDLGS